mgnify:CR=1 FL=1|jgi:type I restriction enzyme S subunit
MMEYSFSELFYDDTKNAKKLKSSEYKDNGKYIIVDQGQKLIAGYTDIENGLYLDTPVIIFGDHTRNIKFIDKPFYLGADGTKVLKSTLKNANYKYLYYALKSSKIPNTGYNRHFKWLKELKFKRHSIIDQENIVNILDSVQEIIAKYNKQLNMLDELVKARFVELFGDPVYNEKQWKVEQFGSLGELKRGKSKHRPRNDPILLGGKYPLIQTGDISNSHTYIQTYKSTYSEEGLKQSKMWKAGTLCITIAANIAESAILTFDACFPDSVVGFLPNDKVNSIFIHHWLNFLQPILEENAPAVAQKNLNVATLEKVGVILPPLKLQNQFANFVKEVDKSRFIIKSMIKEGLL